MERTLCHSGGIFQNIYKVTSYGKESPSAGFKKKSEEYEVTLKLS